MDLLRKRPLQIAVVVVVGYILWRFYYDIAIYHYGTVNPLYVMLWTAPGLDRQQFTSPPSDWKPTSRVVLTLTTMPGDIINLYETLETLGNQTVKADAIYLNVPLKNARTGEEYIIPDYLKTWPGLVIQRTNVDYGPLTKLVPTLHTETDPNTIIITVDDDRQYMPETVGYLTWFAEQEPEYVWGLSGYGIMWYPLPKGMVQVSVPWFMRQWGGRRVDILMAVKGIAYRRRFFNHVDELQNIHQNCFLADDTWIAGYLAVREHRIRVVPPGHWLSNLWLESRMTNWYKDHHANRLRQNTAPDKEFNCIRAVEERFGSWQEVTVRRLREKGVSSS